MFKKSSGLSANMQNRPELSALQQLLTEALEHRGRQVQLVWRAPGTGIFALMLVCNVRGDPRWCLYREHQGKTDLLFDYGSCDVLLVMNLISNSVSEPQKLVRSSFLGGKRAAAERAAEPEVFPTHEEINAAAENAAARNIAAQNVAAEGAAVDDAAAEDRQSPFQNEADRQSSSAKTAALVAPEWPQDDQCALLSEIVSPALAPDNESALPSERLLLSPRIIDAAAIQKVMTSLRRTDTGMFMFPAFLYFLEQEYFRSLRARGSLSVIVFEMYEESVVDGEAVATELPTGAIMDAVLRITALKRHVDLISHYGSCDYAILLPNTKSTGARIFAQRVIDSLLKKPLGDVNPDELCLSLGCASIPEDFVDMSKLLGAAELALDQAHATGSALVMYTDIKDRVQVPE
jgi:hypothetical protein